jgi:hypothetical protein
MCGRSIFPLGRRFNTICLPCANKWNQRPMPVQTVNQLGNCCAQPHIGGQSAESPMKRSAMPAAVLTRGQRHRRRRGVHRPALFDYRLPLGQLLHSLPPIAAEFGDQRDHSGIDAGHQPIGFLPLVVPAQQTRWRRRANRPWPRPADRGGVRGRHAAGPTALGAPRRARCGGRFRARWRRPKKRKLWRRTPFRSRRTNPKAVQNRYNLIHATVRRCDGAGDPGNTAPSDRCRRCCDHAQRGSVLSIAA